MRCVKLMRGPKHEEAERALRLAIERTGHLVPGANIGRAWIAANGAGPLPKEAAEGRWERLLRFSLESGEVFARREDGVFWGLRGAEALTPLPAQPATARMYGKVLLARCARAEDALASAVAKHGRLVTSTEVCVLLTHGDNESGELVPGRLQRVLEPAIVGGRVIVTKVGRTTLLRPADRPELQPPGLDESSDLAKVEEALRRAVSSSGAAVSADAVARLIKDTPVLALRSTHLSVAHHLHVLAREGRAKRVLSPRGGAKSRVYYSTPGGPSRFDPQLALHMDRRWRGVVALWRSSQGRPFTTAAIRRFTRDRDAYRIGDDQPSGWTNALQCFERAGELVAIRGGERFVRWAVAVDWNELTGEERTARLRDEFRVVETERDNAGGGIGPVSRMARVLRTTAPEQDVGFASMNRNMRTLVLLAKRLAAADASASVEAAILATRPVTIDQVRRAAEKCLHLTGGQRDVRRMLHEATRIRPGMRQPAVVKIGAVGRTAYFDLERTEAASAFVEFKQRKWEATRARLRDAVKRLNEAADLSADRVQPLPNAALAAWAHMLWEHSQRHISGLKASLATVQLLEAERRGAEALLEALNQPAHESKALAVHYLGSDETMHASQAASPYLDDEMLLDLAVAWSQISSVAEYKLEHPGLLQNRIGQSVATVRRVVPAAEGRLGAKRGRRIKTYFDRVAFAAYASMRWAGPAWATFAAHGIGVLGPVRSSQPFIACLAAPDQTHASAGAAAALGLLDNASSRSALAHYIARMLTAEASGGEPAPLAALASAAHGLAPKPIGGLATRITDPERHALALLAERRNDYAGQCARRALQAWDECWDRGRLMNL